MDIPPRSAARWLLRPAPPTPAKGSHISTAQVWASTDPTNKVPVNTADGSYSLSGVKHSGTFTVTAEYTATGNSNYTTSDPQNVSTTASTYTQDIALKYGYTTTVSGTVAGIPAGGGFARINGATVIMEVEGVEAGRDTSRNIGGGTANDGRYSITVAHPGRLRARVIPPTGVTVGVRSNLIRTTSSTATNNFF